MGIDNRPEICITCQFEQQRDDLLDACKELADIFPENSMSEMDAADFTDRAHRIWTAAQAAKQAIADATK